nr:kinase [uncultured Blautia sp.]
MRLQKVQEALNTKKIPFEYTEEDGCGSIDFMFRGLKFHVWEYEDRVWGAETNVFAAGRSEDVEGDYQEIISREILSWPDMITPN